MNSFTHALMLTLALALPAGAAPLRPAPNPVLARNFADPMVLKAPDGWYYAYATQDRVGSRWANVQVARSQDLFHWQELGDALPTKPTWAGATQDFWAPHVVAAGNGRYVMYFSSDTPEKKGLCLGVATASNPAGPFVDSGAPLVCGPSFQNIDPCAFDDPKTGKKLLYWGSGFEPLRVQELSDDRLHFKPGSRPATVLWPSRDPYEFLIEGAFVVYHDGAYYLYYSGDNCCSDPAHYAVLVARAETPYGPFVKKSYYTGARDNTILHASRRWDGPGHNAMVTDANGQDWLVYHAIDTKARNSPGTRELRRMLMVDPVFWVDGWPTIQGGVPTP